MLRQAPSVRAGAAFGGVGCPGWSRRRMVGVSVMAVSLMRSGISTRRCTRSS